MTTATRPRRGGRPPIPAEAFEHGDPRRYWRGCHCQLCKRGVTRATKRNRYLRDTGRGTIRPPQRAADHITRLRAAGMDDVAIQHAARIAPDTLYRLLRGGPIHRDTEQRILAVPLPTPADSGSRNHSRVPAVGTLRRLRALIAAGWYTSELARRMGRHKQYVVYLVNGHGGDSVTRRFADEVDAIYQQLATQRPEDHGLPQARIDVARNLAAEKRWRDPLWWEDWGGIDDPDAPEAEPTVKRGVYAEARHRADEIRHLARYGIPPEEIAARVSTPEKTIRVQYVREVIAGTRGPGWRQEQEVAA